MTKLSNICANPCKMCQPLGAITAFYGLKKCMSLLHGSQGCSTYIRRHLATHYNEPVDVASSSLSEEGAVFGGEKNLFKGLDNLIKLYSPDIVAVSTTCLAETIGEDVGAMIKRYLERAPKPAAEVISLSTPGYGGTQFEGWFRALRAVVEQVPMKKVSLDSINVVTGPISPADARELKKTLSALKLNYILLPDISYNLDGPFSLEYNRLPQEGTSIEQISQMAGARVTLELSPFCPDNLSPGLFLRDNYGVDLIRLNLPIGLRDTDIFLKTLKDLGAVIGDDIIQERGRYLDAMLDSHKYSAQGRAALFGEPDLVYSLSRLCVENGLATIVAATGSIAKEFKERVENELQQNQSPLAGPFSVLDGSDFTDIEREAVKGEVNLLVGNGDGRRLAQKRGWPLVRCAFPIHDHVGGQRIKNLFYEGSISLLDHMVNSLCSNLESSFRKDLKNQYFRSNFGQDKVLELDLEDLENNINGMAPASKSIQRPIREYVPKKLAHPCFSLEASHSLARLHLPVAPDCNIGCLYCLRRYDCANESRPGVTSAVLNPEEALERFLIVKKKFPNLSVVGVAGPGEAMASPEKTLETFRLIRKSDSDILFCLSSNGLALAPYLRDLKDLGLSHLTLTVNAVDPKIGQKIYGHVDYYSKRYRGLEAASIILANQMTALKMAVDLGLIVKINTVLIEGLNEEHSEQTAKTCAALGASIGNIMQHIPVKGTLLGEKRKLSRAELQKTSEKCALYLPQIRHCRQCRADAAGLLSDDRSIDFTKPEEGLMDIAAKVENLAAGGGRQVKIAAVSKSGVLVDQHFGQAERFYIYLSDGNEVRLLETRNVASAGGCSRCGKPDTIGGGEARPKGFIDKLVKAVSDCEAVVAVRVGESPQSKLAALGIASFATYESMERAVLAAAGKILTGKSQQTDSSNLAVG
ncbi:MAG: radical SAM protein [Deltaproteobacteria bacterium]|nr:radical SAM protein [Deltaproteobacteria bacterium]